MPRKRSALGKARPGQWAGKDGLIPDASKASADSAPSAADTPSEVRQLGVRLPAAVVERLHNAAWYERIPLARFVEKAIRAYIDRLEKKRGKPFPKRTEPD